MQDYTGAGSLVGSHEGNRPMGNKFENEKSGSQASEDSSVKSKYTSVMGTVKLFTSLDHIHGLAFRTVASRIHHPPGT